MDDAPHPLSLRLYAWRGFLIGAAIGILLLVTGLGEPGEMPNGAQQGGAMIGYPIGTGFVGAIAAFLFGLIRKTSRR